MKFYFFLFFIIIQTYKNEKCEELKSCYNCTISSNNCFWANDLCYSSNEQFSENKFHNNNINKNNFTLFSFITSQYK